MKQLRFLVAIIVALMTGSLSVFAGTILMVHGHSDNPSLWQFQGPALTNASGGSRFYDRTPYDWNHFPVAGFKSNGIYGVTYYDTSLAAGQFEPPISPILVGSTEIPPDDLSFQPILYQQSGSLAARLATIINTAYAQTGQKVTIICHSMGGLVTEAAIAYYGCHDKVDKFVTLGSPLRGFPGDFRVPTEIAANQAGDGFRYMRESLQMSEAILYGGQSFSMNLENRFKLVKPPAMTCVNVAGTLSPFPNSFLTGTNDGVVRAQDARFRDGSLSTVYELPLVHMARLSDLWDSPGDSLCWSERTTQILEKEVLGQVPRPRLEAHLSFNYSSGRIRVTLQNRGGLPLTFASQSARFEIASDTPRVAYDALSSLNGLTLLPSGHIVLDSIPLNPGESGLVTCHIDVNGAADAALTSTLLTHIQAPEIEAGFQYDFLNSLLRRQWGMTPLGKPHSITWDVQYRLNGNSAFDVVSNALYGAISAEFFSVLLNSNGIPGTNVLLAESFPFRLDLARNSFVAVGATILGKTKLPMADPASSPLRDFYRYMLFALGNNQPTSFTNVGRLSGLASLQLDRPVFAYAPEFDGIGLNLRAALRFSYAINGVERIIELPTTVQCAATFGYSQGTLTLYPQLEKFQSPAFRPSANQEYIVGQILAQQSIPLVPAGLADNLNGAIRNTLAGKFNRALADAYYTNIFDTFTVGVDANADGFRILFDLFPSTCAALHPEPGPIRDLCVFGGETNQVNAIGFNGIVLQSSFLNVALQRNQELLRLASAEAGKRFTTFTKDDYHDILNGAGTVFKNGKVNWQSIAVWAGNTLDHPFEIGSWDEFKSMGIQPWSANISLGENYFPGDLTLERKPSFSFDQGSIRTALPLDLTFDYDFVLKQVHKKGVKFIFSIAKSKEFTTTTPSKNGLALDAQFQFSPFVFYTNLSTTNLLSGELLTNRASFVGITVPVKEANVNCELLATIKLNDKLKSHGVSGWLIGILAEILVEPAVQNLRASLGDASKETQLIGTARTVFNKFVPGLPVAVCAPGLPPPKPVFAPEFNNYTKSLLAYEAQVAAQMEWESNYRAYLAYTTNLLGYTNSAAYSNFLSSLNPTFQSLQQSGDGLILSNINVNGGAIRLAMDLNPAYGRLIIRHVSGYDSTNGLVELTPDDLIFTRGSSGTDSLWVDAFGLNQSFSTVWVKRPLSRLKLSFAYDADYLHRYNTNTYLGYSLKFRSVSSTTFNAPTDYAYDPVQDRASFTVEIPLTEGEISDSEFQLAMPDNTPLVVPFSAGRDSAPILLNAASARFDGSSNVLTIGVDGLAFRSEGFPTPAFRLNRLQLVSPSGGLTRTDLLSLGSFTQRTYGPAETRTPALYGVNYQWHGPLAASSFPEGLYHASLSITETSLVRNAIQNIPFVIDRTPPQIELWDDVSAFSTVSRSNSLPLKLRLNDNFSALLNNVDLEYEPAPGLVRTGAVLAADSIPFSTGLRDISFTPDWTNIPDGVEAQYTLRVRASDANNNHGASSNLTVLVDTRPPNLQSIIAYPLVAGPYNCILNSSNHVLTVKLDSSEPVEVAFKLGNAVRGTNVWSGIISTNPAPGIYRTVWTLDVGETDPDTGSLDGSLSDGVYSLSVEMTDRAGNLTSLSSLRTILIDRHAPDISFVSQQSFIPAGRTRWPLDLSTSGFQAGDAITEVSLLNLNALASGTTLQSATIRKWTTAGDIAALRSGGMPLDPIISGSLLPAGRYSVMVTARDAAGNEQSIDSTFGFQLFPPLIAPPTTNAISGIVPINGIAVDPNPADHFSFKNRELYWALGANLPPPANLNQIDTSVWRSSGFYVLPPRGTAFENALNKSAEMVSEGVIAFWNSTTAAIALDGDPQATLPSAGLVKTPVTLLLVVRDTAGQAWATTSTAQVNNEAVDLNALAAPNVQILSAGVAGGQAQVHAALHADVPLVQAIVAAADGTVVHRETVSGVSSLNKLFGRPTYSTHNDFGFFAWFDTASQQLNIRCVSPEVNDAGNSAVNGHSFRFSIRGDFNTNDLNYYHLNPEEFPGTSAFSAAVEGGLRAEFVLDVAPGSEKGVTINYHGGNIMFSALGLDDYLHVLYENGSLVDSRYWRTGDSNAIFPGALSTTLVRNLSGLDGTVMNGTSPEPLSFRAVANHGGAASHVFVGAYRLPTLSPLGIQLSGNTLQEDFSFNWDLRLPNGSQAEPGNYKAYIYTVDSDASRFHGATASFNVSASDVPFSAHNITLSSTNAFNPAGNGGLVLSFNSTRSSTATVLIRNASGQIVATIANGQFIEGNTDTNNPIQVWWDGYVNGAPATNGNYSFDISFLTDGLTNTVSSGVFTVSYPTNSARESDWGLLTQPIAFDPGTRDRITRDPATPANDRAWVTLHFDAKLADGKNDDNEKQVALAWQGGPFTSVATDTNTSPFTYIAVSPLFADAVQRFNAIEVKFNDRVVDAFPPIDLNNYNDNVAVPSRSGQFQFTILDRGPKALRLQMILRATLKSSRTGLFPLLDEFNQPFDTTQVREFVQEVEFREKAGTNGVLQSLTWNLNYTNNLWGYETNVFGSFARFGNAVLDQIYEIEIRDRNGEETLARFNSWQVVPNGTSAVEQLFKLTGYTNRAPADAVGLDLVFETKMANLQTKAASLGVPVSFGYAGINSYLTIPATVASQLSEGQDLDPFPTRYYHTNGTRIDTFNGGRKYDDVKAYSGDSALVQEVNFSSNRIAGHIPFEYSLRPSSVGSKGQQKIQVHPWIPYSFRKNSVTNVWTVEGNQENATMGQALCSGDVNGDGYVDLLVGAPNISVGSTNNAGRVSIFFGGPNGLSNTPSQTINGSQVFGLLGWAIACGDVNKDGYADAMISEGFIANRISLRLGGPAGLSNAPAWTKTVPGSFGYSVACAGDVNGDGYSDFVVGAPYFLNGQTNEGAAFLYLGSSTGLATNASWSTEGNQSEANFGWSVSSAGDVNGDGYSDVIVGAPNFSNGQTNEGAAFVYLGSSTGLVSAASWSIEGNQPNAHFGWSVSAAGDVNGDGYSDVIVGAPNFSNGQTNEGAAFVYLGSSTGLVSTASWAIEGNQPNAIFGSSVSAAGDVNGDGYSDVVIGAPNFTNGQTNEGAVFVYLGSPIGLASSAFWSSEGNQVGITLGGDYYGMSFGYAVAAGDLNGDGYSDVSVGASQLSNGQNFQGRAYAYTFPQTNIYLRGWVRGGPEGGVNLGNLPGTNFPPVNLLSVNPLPNTIVSLKWDPTTKRQRVTVAYSNSLSGYTTNAPFPIVPQTATLWLSNYLATPTIPLPIDQLTGFANTNYATYLANPQLGGSTNEMFLAATPNAYDAVITNAVVDYTFFATDDPAYHPTINYISPTSAWNYVAARLPGYPGFSGLPAVVISNSVRPVVGLTNIVIKADTNFPSLAPAQLNLAFAGDPAMDGGENAYILSAFNHQTSGYFRNWSLADDPNIKAAVQVQPETVQVTLTISNFVYDSSTQGMLTNNTVSPLLNNVTMALSPGLTVTQASSTLSQGGNPLFVRYRNSSVSIRVVRPSSYSAAGEVENMQLVRLDLTTNRTYAVRSSRYQCYITPVISGAGSNTLGFLAGVKLDPPLEYSIRQPLRRTNSIALPLHVIDRQKFWQVDSGEYVANLFKEVAIGQSNTAVSANAAGYVIDSNFGYTQVNGSRILATDSNYYARASALFWKTAQGTIVKNPRVILGNISVVLKDPSGQEESPQFQEQRYVTSLTNEYFNDLYLDSKDLESLSWKAKIRPQAKEHAYVKIYGSVGGNWILACRKNDSGQLSGLLPADSGSLTWTSIASGAGYGQNQFLGYWDVTELNGSHILRLESSASPDNATLQPEAKYLVVMLGQHLPGKNNPIFSPGGTAETVSLFSMHGRTQLTSAAEDRSIEDQFFTVNPINIDEKPFSLGADGVIPLGERVQVLPHTDYNPLSVNFYVDQQEYNLYDEFRLYHQLEGGQLEQITSLPPSVRTKYTLIQGFVEHTSVVGFLPNPSLRLCTLNVPRLSQDGVIRAAGVVDLYGTDNNGVKNEKLTVAVVVSPDANFYNGKVRARLTTGTSAEFPIAAEAAQAQIDTGWSPALPAQTYHVFSVVVNTNDDWLTLNRQLTNTDSGQHLFSITQSAVTMTTNVTSSLAIAGELPIFSPNGDGIADSIQFLLDFQREGVVQLEFVDEGGRTVHRQDVSLDANGQASFVWDGSITASGALSKASDGLYVVTAHYAGANAVSDTASTVVEVRAFSKYFGLLSSAGITNTTGTWRALFTHTGGTVFTNDTIRIQYSDTTNFTIVRGERVVARPELSALFDDTPVNLAPFIPDSNGLLQLKYRMKITDIVGNAGYSPVVSVPIPQASRLAVASVTPSPGTTNASTEPLISIVLSNASPFSADDLGLMFSLAPNIPRSVFLSSDHRTINISPGAPLTPGATVTASLKKYPTAPAPGPDTFTWSFSVMTSNLISRTLQAHLINVPDTLSAIGAKGQGFLIVSNSGNVPAHVSLTSGQASPNVLTSSVPTAPMLALPNSEIYFPVSITVTSQHSGVVSLPLNASELSIGNWASLLMNVSVSSITSAPSLNILGATVMTNSYTVHFAGQSQGSGTISTFARLNGGGWWLATQSAIWSFDASFSSDGDVMEIIAIDNQNRSSSIYSYTFTAPPLMVAIRPDLSLSWDAQLGRTYSLESSTNLIDWEIVSGVVQQSGSTVTIGQGLPAARIVDVPSGRVSVSFSANHPSISAPKIFLRVKSNQ